MKIGHLLTTRLNRSLVEHHGVTFNQVRILFYVHHVAQVDPTRMTLGHLADMLMVSQPNVNGLIARLQKEGYLKKIRSRTDKRAHYLELTPKGKQFLKKLRNGWPPQELHDVDTFFKQLSGTQRKQFTKTLSQIAEYLQEC
jgi:DNA-binding MarR family transcriptional regulator